LVWEECETVFHVERGVECYERLRGKRPMGAAAVLVKLATLLSGPV
jgi:branched-chain amino acid transport system substrate-binding protein